jgi:uncharacterized coiled-coil DUF342 family protein
MNEEKRKEWESRTRAQLDALEAEMETLRAKGQKLSGEAKEQHDSWMKKLKSRAEQARERFNTIKEASDSSWDQVREGSENIWDDFTSAVSGAKDALVHR